jgi:predicted  nucleic acid-binding Zn-ribbon protein
MEHVDSSSVKSSNTIENECPQEHIETLLKKLQIKNQRVKELENKVNAQAKELQSIASLVEKKINKLQSTISTQSFTIRDLEIEKQTLTEQLVTAQREFGDCRKRPVE